MSTNPDGLEVGTLMIHSMGGLYSHRRVVKIDRLTPTQVIVGATKFRRADRDVLSRVGGGTWSGESIVKATPEILAELREERRHSAAYLAVRDRKWKEMNADQLERIAAICDEAKP